MLIYKVTPERRAVYIDFSIDPYEYRAAIYRDGFTFLGRHKANWTPVTALSEYLLFTDRHEFSSTEFFMLYRPSFLTPSDVRELVMVAISHFLFTFNST